MAKEDERGAKAFADAVKQFDKTQSALSSSLKTDVKDGLVDTLKKASDPFTAGLKSIPGMGTLGAMGKTLFNKSFAALKDRREKAVLRDRLGINKEDFKIMAAAKANNDAFAKMSEEMGTAAKSLLGFDVESMEDFFNQKDDSGKFMKLSDSIEGQKDALLEKAEANEWIQKKNLGLAKKSQGNKAAEQEAADEAARAKKKEQSIFLDIRDSMSVMASHLGKMLKDMAKKGAFGLGILGALILAPFVALGAFLKELGLQIRLLGKIKFVKTLFTPLVKGWKKLKGVFAPLTNFFKLIKNSAWMKTIGGPAFTKAWTAVKGFFTKIGNFFKAIMKFGGSGGVVGKILAFAKGFGTILGKIFLPLTLVMGAFDFITGFIDGYKEGGIMSGLEGGFTKLFVNLIGMPLDLLKDGVAWILKKFGFDESSAALKSFSFSKLISDMIGGLFSFIGKAIDWVKLLFTDPVAALKVLWTSYIGVYASIGGFLVSIFDKAINWIMGVFGWKTEDEKPFSLVKTVTDAFDKAWIWIKGIFGFEGDSKKSKFSLVNTVIDALEGVWTWLKGIFDIDVKALIARMPKAIQWLAGKAGIIPTEAEARAAMSPEEGAAFDANKKSQEEAAARVAAAKKSNAAFLREDTRNPRGSLVNRIKAAESLLARRKKAVDDDTSQSWFGNQDTAEEKAKELVAMKAAEEKLLALQTQKTERDATIANNNTTIKAEGAVTNVSVVPIQSKHQLVKKN